MSEISAQRESLISVTRNLMSEISAQRESLISVARKLMSEISAQGESLISETRNLRVISEISAQHQFHFSIIERGKKQRVHVLKNREKLYRI